MEENLIWSYLREIPHYLSTPMGIAGVVAVFLYAGYCVFGRGGVLAAVCVLLTVGIVAREDTTATSSLVRAHLVLIPVVEMIRTANRAIFGLTLILLVLRLLTDKGVGWRRESIPKSVLALGAVQILYALGWIVQGDLGRGGGSVLLSALLVVGLAGMLGKVCRNLADVRSIFRAAEVAGLLFCGMSLAQVMLNPVVAYLAGRFQGISANPQYAAIFTAVLVNIAVYMAGTSTEPKLLRVLHFICAVVFGGFMMWTGSRTGFVILAVGLTIQLHLRPWMMLLTFVGGLVGMQLLTHSNEYATASVQRLVTYTSTGRDENWALAWAYFLRYPIFGRPMGAIESCYLAVASGTGLVGLSFLFLCGSLHLQNLAFIWRNRRWLGEERRIVDLLVAWSLALLGASFFEGFVLAIATAAIVFVVLLLSLTGMVREYIELAAENAEMEGYRTETEGAPAMG